MNYPKGINKSSIKKTNFGNRGMILEEEINITNKYYLDNDIAVIYKKPTPITINKVDYKARNNAVIKEAHFIVPSTTDYNGIYKGKYIDFDAKETKLNSFPLNNIHSHQINHLNKVYNHGGIAFIIVRFVKYNEIYFLTIEKLNYFLDNNTRSSIPYTYFIKNGIKIEEKYIPRIDYLKAVDYLLKEENYEN